ncbi:MAG: hypothetical protein IJJ40_06925 [Clostridia bacterium]|nr:hypothetical protein [Clostridia bacterium]
MKKTYFYNFNLRLVATFFVLFCLFLFTVLKIISINLKDYDKLAAEQSSIKIEAGNTRGSILDKNGFPLTNSKTVNLAAINPTKSAISEVNSLLKGEERAKALEQLNNNKPCLCILPYNNNVNGITVKTVPVRVTENTVCHHIVGYLDGEYNGAYGIEKAYNDILGDKTPLVANFTSDGKGNVLLGVEPYFTGGEDALSNAVYLTIDINIQKQVEEISKDLTTGAVVVAESKSNKIVAMVSLPDFSPYDISASLSKENSPLVNKCLNCYNVGSAFKPAIAAGAIKEGLVDYTVDCTGSLSIENRVFNCHKRDGHGSTDLISAIKNSCNCYFYNLSGKMSSDALYKSAEYFSLSGRTKIADNLYSDFGVIPSKTKLNTLSSKANFAIGQGDVMLSPVSMLNLYSAIANGGEYYIPSVVEKTIIDGVSHPYDKGLPTKAIDSKTAEFLKRAMIEVIESGTGVEAKSDKVSAAGKTATAETGRIDQNGNRITNSWFCGFFPVEDPKYTVIIMSDGKHNKTPAEIFKAISETITR